MTSIHYENFIYASRYLTVPRWWLELIGYWGAPGTAAPGHTASPIKPINVRPQMTKEDYIASGLYAPYPPAGLQSVKPAEASPENLAGIRESVSVSKSALYDMTESMTSASVAWTQEFDVKSTLFSVMLGVAVGVLGTLMVMAKRPSARVRGAEEEISLVGVSVGNKDPEVAGGGWLDEEERRGYMAVVNSDH